MKLFIFDEKHQQVNGVLELALDSLLQSVIGEVIDFLNKNNMTDRYSKLVLADEYIKSYDENGESVIEFEGQLFTPDDLD